MTNMCVWSVLDRVECNIDRSEGDHPSQDPGLTNLSDEIVRPRHELKVLIHLGL